MKEKADAKDAEIEAENKENKEQQAKRSWSSRLSKYNNPKILILLGVLASLLAGASQPCLGVVMSKYLTYVAVPIPYLRFIEPDFPGTASELLDARVSLIGLILTGMAVIAGVSKFVQFMSFQFLGNQVTQGLRLDTYAAILDKNIGWFDDKDHSTGILTTALAEDASIINGAGAGSLPAEVEAALSMLTGLTLAFVYCWQVSLAILALTPLSMVGKRIQLKMHYGLANQQGETQKEANLLSGDAIANFKTIQSFGHEDKIMEKYNELVAPSYELTKKENVTSGIAFGITNFINFIMMGVMFWVAGVIMRNSPVLPAGGAQTQGDGNLSIDPGSVFLSVFALMFGASHAATAQAFGPDVGKAKAAADRIFEIKEHKSLICASALDKDTTKKRLNLDEVKGHIEFRDVWFRYPTRKEDFVLKGLSIVINPSERVALVGESGCGKSTFVALLMRFYDVDAGQVLLDGTDIREINLHDLRLAISLVMQEPIIFHYSILENVLYGRLDATNLEVRDACKISNALEFIEGGRLRGFDTTADGLLKEMQRNKEALVNLIGQEKYDEEIDVLTKMQGQEQYKKEFQASTGVVDQRPAELKGDHLHGGFDI